MTSGWRCSTSEDRRLSPASATACREQQMTDDDEDAQRPYEVGYGCPPVANRWKKGGASPNPKGRPPGSQTRRAITRRVAEEKRAYSEGGRRKVTENIVLVAMTVRNYAAKGDLSAIKLYDWLEGQQRLNDHPLPKGVLIVGEKLPADEWAAKFGHLADP